MLQEFVDFAMTLPAAGLVLVVALLVERRLECP